MNGDKIIMTAMWKKDIKVLWMKKKAAGLLAIILLVLIASAFLTSSDKPLAAAVRVGIVDKDNSDNSTMLISFFKNNEVLSSYVEFVEGRETEIETMFQEEALDMYLILPKDFTANLIQIKNTPIQVKMSTKETIMVLLFQNLLEAYGSYIEAVQLSCVTLFEVMKQDGMEKTFIYDTNRSISYDLIFTALGKDQFFDRMELERFESISLVRYYSYALFIILILYGGIFAGLNLLQEHRRGILARLKITGTSMWKIILEKFLYYSVLYSSVFLLLMGIVTLIGGIAFPLYESFVILLAISGSVMLFLLLSAFFKKTTVFLLTSNMLVLLFTMIGGGIIPIMYLPEAIVKLAYITPNYWFVRAMLQLENETELQFGWFFVVAVFGIIMGIFICALRYNQREGRRYAQI